MPSVRIHRQLRPLRLGFLVQHDDRVALQRVIETNTCIWGGRYNAIIPLYARHVRIGSRRWPPERIVQGYLDRYEPDFLVDLTGEGKKFFSDERVIRETDVLDRSRHGMVTYGLGMNTLFTHLYDKEYKFARRHDDFRYVLPRWSDPSRSLLFSAAFGAYPTELTLLSDNYEYTFAAATKDVTAKTFHELLRCGTPLKMTAASTRSHRSGPSSPAVFLMSHERSSDVIDYWNLRALGWQLIPLPINARAELVDSARTILNEQMRWYADNLTLMRKPIMLLGARSVSAERVASYARLLQGDAPFPPRSRTAYPPIWQEEDQSHDTGRCTVVADEDDIERTSPGSGPGSYIIVEPLAPVFDTTSRFGAEVAWANVISASSDEAIQTVAPIIPSGVHNAESLLGAVFRRTASVTREGMVFYGGLSSRMFIHLPSSEEVARAWFRQHGFTAKPSPAGRIAQSMIRAINGLLGAESLAHLELLQKLNGLCLGSAAESHAEPGSVGGKPKARARSESYKRFRALLMKIRNGNRELVDQHLRHLLDSGVLRLGLELSCPECTQRSWFGLDAIGALLKCERCGADFSFPVAEPPHSDAWQYRTGGPFGIENYAQGAYAVVLALRFFILQFHSPEVMWITSTELKSDSRSELEVDFAIWHRDALTPHVSLLIGEAKSFGIFKNKDFENARSLASAISGSYSVFATLRPDFTPGERRRLRSLAVAGRQSDDTGVWRNPLIILTGRELLGGRGFPYCWQDLGEPFNRAASIAKPSTDLLSLAQATQLAHLGLEPEVELLRATHAMRDDDDWQANFLRPRRLRKSRVRRRAQA